MIERVPYSVLKPFLMMALGVFALTSLAACADVNVPEARTVNIPSPVSAEPRRAAINERPDSVMYLPLGDDVLVPEVLSDNPLPSEIVGPFELRNETLAGALQLILADYDISLAFETDEAFNRRVTVANLQGELDKVVRRVCSLANMYCSYEDAGLIVKDVQTFTVTVPPIGSGEDSTSFLSDIAEGLSAVLGEGDPIVDTTTRTIVYTATQRTSEIAARYFQRLRANTAMIVFETYIWEVSLNAGNSTGIDWSLLDTAGKFNFSIGVDGAVGTNFTNPISIGLPTTSAIGATPTDVLNFLSRFGAVKSISQPQITVLSGSEAELRVAETENYVSEVTTTLNGEGSSSTSVNTDSVDSGFTLNIGSTWDKSTVYADIDIALTNVLAIDNFVFSDGGDEGTSTSIQLPQTTERELTTQIRVRPGDSVLIAGLVQEQDNFNNEGPGFMEPILPQSRTAETENLELVFLLRPRVVAYTMQSEEPAQVAMKAVRSEAVMSARVPVSSGISTLPTPTSQLEPEQELEPQTTRRVVETQPRTPLRVSAPDPEPVVYSNRYDQRSSSSLPLAPVTPEPIAVSPSLATLPEPEPVIAEPIQPVSVSPSVQVSDDIYTNRYEGRSSIVSDRVSSQSSPVISSSNGDSIQIYDLEGTSAPSYSTYGASSSRVSPSDPSTYY